MRVGDTAGGGDGREVKACSVGIEEDVDMAVDRAEQYEFLEELGAAGLREDVAKQGVDVFSELGVVGLGSDTDRSADHEVDQRVEPPGDIVLDDGFMAGHLIAGCMCVRATEPRGEALRLSEPALFGRVAVVLPECVEAGLRECLVVSNQAVQPGQTVARGLLGSGVWGGRLGRH